MSNESTFLDIGSGGGKVVLQVALEVGCRAHGIEVLANRIECSETLKQRLILEENAPSELADRATFEMKDATYFDHYMIDGHDASHIFAFSEVFSQENLISMISILNRTNFKMLVFNCRPDRASTLGLRYVISVG